MLTVNAKLTYVDNGIIVELVAEEILDPGDMNVPAHPIVHRRVFADRQPALEFVQQELWRINPGEGIEMVEVPEIGHA